MLKAQLRNGALLIVAGALACLGGCSSIFGAKPAESQAPAKVAENPEARFGRAMALLEQGKADEADAELRTYLNAVPKSKSAQFLIEQIETPIEKLFPKRSFRLKLAKHANLSSIAKTYLGNCLAFYGLARYNRIAVPAEVHEGQTIRIPSTSFALAVWRTAVQPAEASDVAPANNSRQLSAESNGNEAAAPPQQSISHAQAEQYYLAGLIAFQKQDLDAAIAAWHDAVAADPGFAEAQLHLQQAEQLKQSLEELQK